MTRWAGNITSKVNARGMWMRSGEVESIPTLWPVADASDTQPLRGGASVAVVVSRAAIGHSIDGDDDPTETEVPRIHTVESTFDNRARATHPPAHRRSAMRPRPSAVFDEGTLRPTAITPHVSIEDDDTLTLEVDTGWHTHLTAGARPVHAVRHDPSPDPRSTQVSGTRVALADTEPYGIDVGFEPVPLLSQGPQGDVTVANPSDDIDISGFLAPEALPQTKPPQTKPPTSSAWVRAVVRLTWFMSGFVLFGSTAASGSLLTAMLVYGALFIS